MTMHQGSHGHLTHLMIDPRDIPDSAVVYVPGFGETTAGALRASYEPPPDPVESTIRMWEAIVLNVDHPRPYQTEERT